LWSDVQEHEAWADDTRYVTNVLAINSGNTHTHTR
jgi:hypothetical protein